LVTGAGAGVGVDDAVVGACWTLGPASAIDAAPPALFPVGAHGGACRLEHASEEGENGYAHCGRPAECA
jgi:hypothetical protein